MNVLLDGRLGGLNWWMRVKRRMWRPNGSFVLIACGGKRAVTAHCAVMRGKSGVSVERQEWREKRRGDELDAVGGVH